jgi:hypothetical protein
VQVEDIAREGFAPRRAAQQQRQCPIRSRLLRQVVVDHQGVLPLVHPVRSDGGSGIRRHVLEGGRVRCRGVDHDRVLEGTIVPQRLDHLRDGRRFLAHGHVDALDLTIGSPELSLIDDGVHHDGGLARLPVSDDQLTLSPADGGHGVDGLDARIHWLFDRLSLHHGGRLDLQPPGLLELDGSLAVHGFAKSVDHPAQQAVSHRHREDPLGALDRVAFFDVRGLSQDDASDLVLFEVQGQTQHAARELQQLVRHGGGETGDPGDAVPGHEDPPHLFGLQRGFVTLDVLAERLRDLFR